VLDAEAGILEQDKKIAARIVEERKACVVVVNKWDLVSDAVRKAQVEEMTRRNTTDRRGTKRLITLSEFGEWVQELLFFLDYAPVIFTSALSGFHLDRLLESVRFVAAQLRQEIPTSILNRVLRDAMERQHPVSATGHFLKFFYATQTGQQPPTFLVFVNRDEFFSDTYKKYLQREVRRAFGFEGCPIVLVAKARPKSIEPVRRHRQRRSPTARASKYASGRR
jgi:GTPase